MDHRQPVLDRVSATGVRAERAALPLTVYSPQSALHDPVYLFREMALDVWTSRGLAWRLFLRDVSARYRQSALGYAWALLPPIVTTLTFVLLSRSGVLSAGRTGMPYPVYVITGTLLWQLFADAMGSPIKTVTAAKVMLSKINFPREALLIAGVLDVLFNALVRMVLLVAAFAAYRIVPPASAPLALLGVAAILCTGFTLGLLLTPLGLLYTDIGQALTLMLSFWMLLTPVVYNPPSGGALDLLTKINPVSPLIVVTREWLTTGTASQLVPAAAVTGTALVFLIAAWVLYRLAMPILVERMGG
jgi:lipopolysaccharide transport system permease protein